MIKIYAHLSVVCSTQKMIVYSADKFFYPNLIPIQFISIVPIHSTSFQDALQEKSFQVNQT